MIDTEFDSEHNMFSWVKDLKKEKYECEWAQKIAALLVEEDNSWKKTELLVDNLGSKHEKKITTAPEANDRKADTPLLLATKNNSTDIVELILKRRPQAVDHVDKDGRNILHLAILHRRYEIIEIVEKLDYAMERLSGKLDKNYNTLLHMVGQKVDDLKEDVMHPAKELQQDQHLYEVSVCIYYIMYP